jgi:hypothetical protein
MQCNRFFHLIHRSDTQHIPDQMNADVRGEAVVAAGALGVVLANLGTFTG